MICYVLNGKLVYPSKKDANERKNSLPTNQQKTIYDIYIQARIAKKLKFPFQMDKEGNVVKSKAKQYGELYNIQNIHLDYILFANKTGCNTNQKNDKNIAGIQYLIQKGQFAKMFLIQSNHTFRLFLIIAATGEPVIYIIILQAKSNNILDLWYFSINIIKNLVFDNKTNILIGANNCG